MENFGKCKLCLKDAFLCESHIIPEFFYKPLYDNSNGKHDALVVNVSPYRERSLRSGFYERLLCNACEGLLNREYETYVIELWQTKFPGLDKGNTFIIEPVEYRRFKLFHLSVLWRAGVSNRAEFKNVTLGPHEEILREKILSGDPGSDESYSFYGNVLMLNGEPFNMIINPLYGRNDGHRVYIFYFGTCKWLYRVSSHSDSHSVRNKLAKTGILYLPKLLIENDKSIGVISDAMNAHYS